jgi:type I restriction enzyme S subunit
MRLKGNWEGATMSREGWKTYKLGDLCSKIGSGATPRGGKEAYLDEGPFTLIRSQNVLDFLCSTDGLAFISEEQANQLSNVELKGRDVLLNITGDSVARVCQIPSALLPGRVNQHVSIIRPDESKLLPEFLKYYLLNPSFKNYMLGLASVGGTRNALTKGMIEYFEIEVPPRDIQRRIAAILSALDEKTELNRQTNATLEAIAQAIFKEWFVDFHFPGATGEMQDSEFGPIPEGWSLREASSLFDVKDGTHDSPKYASEGYSLITSKHLKKDGQIDFGSANRISREDYNAINRRSKVDNNDVLYSMIGTIGNILLVDQDSIDFAIKNIGLFKTSQRKDIASYFYHYLKSDFACQYFRERFSGSTQQYVTLRTMRELPVLLPSEGVISTFNRIIEPILNDLQNNLKQLVVLMQTRDSLLPRLMSGEIEI